MTKSTIYTFSKCDEADGYFLANCECVCTQTCSDKVTSKPEHSQYVEVDCTACGVSTKIKDHWECNDGYHKNTAGTGCEADITESCESKGYSTNKPTSRGYLCKDATVSLNGVNSTCYDCVACEDEYLITSNSCQQICENYGIDAQSRSYYKINTITSLNNRTGGPCYEGRYSIHKSDCCCEGLGAVALADCEEPIEPEDCPAGYASTVGECGSQGVAGWELGAKYGSMNCYECKARTCPIVSVSGFGSGSATRDVQSTISNNVANCGSYAGNGWTVVATGKYSGDEQCFVCRPNACPTGYKPGVSSVADCGAQAANGWDFSASNLANGNDPCGKCSKLKCQNGYSSSVSAANCKPGESFTSLGFSGDTPCGKCVEEDCSAGYSKSITSETDCSAGYTFEQELGNPLCGKCNVNCANQYKELKILAAVAEKSYFNCCKAKARYETNLCRTSANNSVDGCLSKRNGAWDDGCFSRFEKIIDNDSDLELGADYTSITEAIAACKAKLQNIKETIRFYNSECPNNKITDNINISNCEHVMFRGDALGDIDQNLSFDYRGCPDGYSGTGGH